jgi:hypothetical protein
VHRQRAQQNHVFHSSEIFSFSRGPIVPHIL